MSCPDDIIKHTTSQAQDTIFIVTSKLDIARRTITVREATHADAAAFATIHIAAWKAAYKDMVPQHELDSLRYGQKYAMWKRILLAPVPGTRLTVAQEDGEVIAWSTHGPRRDGKAAGMEGEIHGLYAHPAVFGRGAGALLLEDALDYLDERWATSVVWALSANESALRTYARSGFELARERVILPESPQYVQTMMRRTAKSETT